MLQRLCQGLLGEVTGSLSDMGELVSVLQVACFPLTVGDLTSSGTEQLENSSTAVFNEQHYCGQIVCGQKVALFLLKQIDVRSLACRQSQGCK